MKYRWVWILYILSIVFPFDWSISYTYTGLTTAGQVPDKQVLDLLALSGILHISQFVHDNVPNDKFVLQNIQCCQTFILVCNTMEGR